MPDDRLVLTYVCGAAHSGSTILEILLGRHSEVCNLGEMVFLPWEIAKGNPCSCGEALNKCSEWCQMLNKLGGELGINLFDRPDLLNIGIVPRNKAIEMNWSRIRRVEENVLAIYEYLVHELGLPDYVLQSLYKIKEGMDNSWRLCEIAAKMCGKSVVVDSSKRYGRALSLYSMRPEQVKVILLVRDGRSVIASHIKRGRSPEIASRMFKRTYLRSLRLFEKRIDPKSWIIVKYEDLVDDPKTVICKIFNFLGLVEEDVLSPDESSDVSHSAGGNWVRYGKNLEIKQPTPWEEQLTKQQEKTFYSIAGNLNEKLGYK